MRITVNIKDDLIKSVMELSGGKNRTEGMIIALEDYVYRKRISHIIEDLRKNPIEFVDGFSAESVRKLNRASRL